MNKIYCDMDGVLVDFLSGAVQRMNEILHDPPDEFMVEAAAVAARLGRPYVVKQDLEKYTDNACPEARNFMYRALEDDEEFWANLPWMPGGAQLWEYLKDFNPTILTSPMDKGGKLGSLAGKRRWIKKNIGLDNIEGLVFEHNKYEYALDDDGNPNVLIDDFMAKIGPWREAGGIGIHHPDANAPETIAALEALENVPQPANT